MIVPLRRTVNRSHGSAMAPSRRVCFTVPRRRCDTRNAVPVPALDSCAGASDTRHQAHAKAA